MCGDGATAAIGNLLLEVVSIAETGLHVDSRLYQSSNGRSSDRDTAAVPVNRKCSYTATATAAQQQLVMSSNYSHSYRRTKNRILG